MLERRKQPRTEIRKSSLTNFDRPGLFAGRPRKVDVRGHQGPEYSAAGGNQSRWLGPWLLAAVAGAPDGAPQTPNRTVRKAMTVDARLRVGVLVIALAAVVMSTNFLGSLAETTGSIASRVRTSVVVFSQKVNVETLAPLLEIKPYSDRHEHSGNTHASPANHKRADNRSCVRPEVYRTASDLNRFWWLLRDPNGRTIKEAPNTYASETEARIAADDAATKHACNTRVTATRMNARDGGRSVNPASATN